MLLFWQDKNTDIFLDISWHQPDIMSIEQRELWPLFEGSEPCAQALVYIEPFSLLNVQQTVYLQEFYIHNNNTYEFNTWNESKAITQSYFTITKIQLLRIIWNISSIIGINLSHISVSHPIWNTQQAHEVVRTPL